jgi:hypothetical protein
MRTSLLICFALFGATVVCTGDERTKEQIKAAKEFTFEGIPFSTTLEQFKKKHPSATPGEDTDSKIGVAEFRFDSDAATIVSAKFFQGKLYRITMLYEGVKLSNVGGSEALLERLTKKFGKPDANSRGIISKGPLEWEGQWAIPDASRFVKIHAALGSVEIGVADTAIYDKLLAKRKASNSGFDK